MWGCFLGVTLVASAALADGAAAEEGTVSRRGRDWVPIAYFKDIVPGSALDFSNVVPRERFAGEHGWVKAVGDHFECEGEPGRVRRFYGVNLCANANFPTHEETDMLVERLVRMGYNSVRLHHQDGGWVSGRKPGEVLNETEMEKFDYLCAQLIRRGLYLTTDLYVSRSVRRSEIGLDGDGRLPYEAFKGLIAVHEPAFENWAHVATNFLLRTNVHTGRRYIDEPAMAFLSLVNENTFGQAWNAIMGEKPTQRAWYAWVKAERAKDPTDVPAVLETLPVSKLGYVVAYSAYTDRFQADLERRMFTRMRDLLRSLGCRALFTNQNCGRRGPAMQLVGGDLYDYVDDHFYAPHAELPKGATRGIYYVPNCNNVTDSEFAACRAAFARNAAKPFVATEFNFARPASFRGQGGLLAGAFAGRQDWSGLWRFAYAHHRGCLPDGKGNIGRFDVSVDPLMAATERAVLTLFMRGDMPRLGPALYLRPSDRAIRHPANNQAIPAAPRWMTAAWTRRIAVMTSGEAPADGPVFDLADVAGITKDAPVRSPVPELSDVLLCRNVDKGSFSVDTPGTKGGFAFPSDRIAVPGFSADVTDAPMTVWVSSLDGKATEASERLVLTILTDVRGDGQSFADAEERWLTAWGEWFPEPLVRRGTAHVALKHARSDCLRVWALDTSGRRLRAVAAKASNGELVFEASTVGTDGKGCLAYEIAALREQDVYILRDKVTGKTRTASGAFLLADDGAALKSGRYSLTDMTVERSWTMSDKLVPHGRAVFPKGVETDSLRPFPVLRPVPDRLRDGNRRYQSCPSITASRGGRLWVSFMTGDGDEGNDNAVVVLSSGDGGKTWTPPLFAIDAPGPLRTLDSGLWTDEKGDVWLFYPQVLGFWDGRGGLWAMRAKDPENVQTDWTAARRISDGYLKNKPTRLRDGRLLLPIEFFEPDYIGFSGVIGNFRLMPFDLCHDNSFGLDHANVFEASDGLTDVRFLGQAQHKPKEHTWPEHMIVERRDGSLWMLMRMRYGLGESVSTDGGKTWSEVKPSSIAAPSARFHLSRLKSGALLLVKNGDLREGKHRNRIFAYLSDDDGRTWVGGLELDARDDVSYPDAVETADGFIHVVNDFSRTKAAEIVHHRFTEADIRAGKVVSRDSRLGDLVNKAAAPQHSFRLSNNVLHGKKVL